MAQWLRVRGAEALAQAAHPLRQTHLRRDGARRSSTNTPIGADFLRSTSGSGPLRLGVSTDARERRYTHRPAAGGASECDSSVAGQPRGPGRLQSPLAPRHSFCRHKCGLHRASLRECRPRPQVLLACARSSLRLAARRPRESMASLSCKRLVACVTAYRHIDVSAATARAFQRFSLTPNTMSHTTFSSAPTTETPRTMGATLAANGSSR
jgi:hypothetical protein